MKKPEQTPLDPTTPRTKKVNQIPMPKLYPESMEDDVYSEINLDKVNKLLDQISDEDSQNSN